MPGRYIAAGLYLEVVVNRGSTSCSLSEYYLNTCMFKIFFLTATMVGLSDDIYGLADEDTIQALVSVVSQCGDIREFD